MQVTGAAFRGFEARLLKTDSREDMGTRKRHLIAFPRPPKPVNADGGSIAPIQDQQSAGVVTVPRPWLSYKYR